jgi:hypothetical protein
VLDADGVAVAEPVELDVAVAVNVALGVEVAVVVGVADPVAVAVGVEVDEDVAVAVGVAVGDGTTPPNSNAPISHAVLEPLGSGRAAPRWSAGGHT